jgi:DNA-binding beta-propeller fold protein YncE
MNIKRIFLSTGILLLVTASAALAWLIYPATPGSSRSLRFDGFIVLPQRTSLNVLDYLTFNGRDLFVAATSLNSLFRISTDPNQAGRNQAVGELTGAAGVHGVAFVSSMNAAFFTEGGTDTVGVLDSRSFRRTGSIPVADDPDAILYAERPNLIYVANGDAKLATLIDPVARATVGAIQLGGKPEFPVLDPKDGLLYQNLKDTNSVAVVDLMKRAMVDTWSIKPCEGPTGMAIDFEHRRLFSVCSGNAMLVVFDLDNHHLIATLEVVSKPDSVAFDAQLQRIYVAGVGGFLTVIRQNSPDSYEALEQIYTHYGAHTLALDPQSHKIYVAYASLLTYPRIAIFSPE